MKNIKITSKIETYNISIEFNTEKFKITAVALLTVDFLKNRFTVETVNKLDKSKEFKKAKKLATKLAEKKGKELLKNNLYGR